MLLLILKLADISLSFEQFCLYSSVAIFQVCLGHSSTVRIYWSNPLKMSVYVSCQEDLRQVVYSYEHSLCKRVIDQ